ncbi:MAG: hypothetical protein DRG69_09780 [Deltaproteobacteria bacterium]|nr:MAG: hypothetical protein DRG69_09780 [Deltaproteobacteria bacterium]
MAETVKDKLKRLYELQTIDERIRELQTKFRGIPIREKQIEEERDRAKASLEEKRNRYKEMLKLQGRKNLELEEQGEKLNRYKAQRFQVKTNEAFAALEREIEATLKRRAELEEEILELMISIDSFSEELKEEEERYRRAEEKYRRNAEELKKAAEKLKSKMQTWIDKRNALIPKIDPDILRRYEEWRRKGDFMLSVVDGNVCGRCFLALPPQTVAELRKGERLITCNSCGRVLIWKGWIDEDA